MGTGSCHLHRRCLPLTLVREGRSMNNRGLAALGLVLIVTGWSFALSVGSRVAAATPQAKPEGEMRSALYVPLSPVRFDPGEVGLTGLSAFWVLYAYDPAKAK